MRIHIASVMVDDQEKALQFYTEKLGFVLKHDIPAGGARWLTVVSPDGPEGVELLLEPVNNPAVPAREFQQALYDAGIPWTTFASDDIQAEYERLTARGVRFTQPPTDMGSVTGAIFDDTCGNLIMLVSG
ncbi:MAG TPA: VOC family protein [Thermomicrobiales bacterium]|nr:VOC family protein [Thermomicrobiales bacterium]